MEDEKALWYELLEQLVGRAGLSRPQVARRAGVSVKTMTSWLRGDVQSPRSWRPLARVLRALRATTAEANRVLQGAGHLTVDRLAARATEEEGALLEGWLEPGAPFMPPDRTVAALVGREAQLAQAADLLRRERRCVLLGMAGIGKTTLAVELAHRLRHDYPDGVFWGDLRTGVADAVLESWGQACGVDMERLTDFNSRAAAMRAVFSRKRALIVLDDVVESRPALQMMPAQEVKCAVLATTRSADAARALVRQRRGLTVQLAPMDREQSLALLATILGEEVVATAGEAAEEVAALVGDMPLALHICAALCADEALSLAHLAVLLRELRHRLNYLRLEEAPVVRLAFEQSWALLDEQTRRGLATLAVFAGRVFRMPAFAASAGLSEAEAALLLTRLRRRSLLAAAGEGAYQQHTLLAAFSAEKLADDDAAWRRFSDYYGGLVSGAGWQRATGPDGWGNVMAGMATAHRLAAWPLVAAYARALQVAWRRQGLYGLAREGCAWAVEAARAMEDERTEAELRLAWGRSCLEQSDYGPAREQLGEALSLFTALGETAGVANAEYHLARVEMEQGNYEAAEEAIQRAYRAYQQEEDAVGMGRSLYRLGYVTYFRGDNEGAAKLAADAIRSQRQAGDKVGLLRSHRLATQALILLGRMEEAEEHCREAAELVEEVADRAERAAFYYTYADLLRQQEAFAEAQTYANRALDRFREMADASSEANALLLLAGIEVFWNDAEPERRQFEAGLAYCGEGLLAAGAVGYDVGRAFLLLMKGRLLAQDGQAAAACETWREAMGLAQALEHAWLQQRLQTLMDEARCQPNLAPPPNRPQDRSPAP